MQWCCAVSGAGDCLTAGFLAALLRGADQHTAVAAGMQGNHHLIKKERQAYTDSTSVPF
jgi:sugar/nucleoside kinase (ribokinase family)